MKFKVGDLVRIIKQSNYVNSHVHMVGLTGFIEDIQGEYASFQELNNKMIGGCGSVPLSCLEIANDDINLQNLKIERDKRHAKLQEEVLEYSKKYNDKRSKLLTQISEKYKISLKKANDIFLICEEFINNNL